MDTDTVMVEGGGSRGTELKERKSGEERFVRSFLPFFRSRFRRSSKTG